MTYSTKTGRCLCGNVRFTAKTVGLEVHACHCHMCRRWNGASSLSVHCGVDVIFDGEDNLSQYTSSDWAYRGFCKKCGSGMFYLLKETGEYILPVGVFDNQDGFIFNKQIFIDEKPEYYCFANKTVELTGEEVFMQVESLEGK